MTADNGQRQIGYELDAVDAGVVRFRRQYGHLHVSQVVQVQVAVHGAHAKRPAVLEYVKRGYTARAVHRSYASSFKFIFE